MFHQTWQTWSAWNQQTFFRYAADTYIIVTAWARRCIQGICFWTKWILMHRKKMLTVSLAMLPFFNRMLLPSAVFMSLLETLSGWKADAVCGPLSNQVIRNSNNIYSLHYTYTLYNFGRSSLAGQVVMAWLIIIGFGFDSPKNLIKESKVWCIFQIKEMRK